MTPLVEGGEIIEGLGDRVLGRTALEEIRDPFSGEISLACTSFLVRSSLGSLDFWRGYR